jgi:hypothetical protein
VGSTPTARTKFLISEKYPTNIDNFGANSESLRVTSEFGGGKHVVFLCREALVQIDMKWVDDITNIWTMKAGYTWQ